MHCTAVWFNPTFLKLHELGDDKRELGSGCLALWGEGVVAGAVDDALADGPGHGVIGVAADLVAVAEVVNRVALYCWAAGVAVEDGDHLFSGEGVFWGEVIVADAADDAIFCCPFDAVCVPCAVVDVVKVAVEGVVWVAFEVMQHSDEHGSVGDGVWGELSISNTVEDASTSDDLDGFFCPVA